MRASVDIGTAEKSATMVAIGLSAGYEVAGSGNGVVHGVVAGVVAGMGGEVAVGFEFAGEGGDLGGLQEVD